MSDYYLKTADQELVAVSVVHEVLLELLLEFDRICQKHQLDYVLAYGSQLGAVRHQGFIPWDDDLDILMPRSDYEKLLTILPDELAPSYYAHCYEYDQGYNVLLPSMKLKKHGTKIVEKTPLLKNRLSGDGVFIDIFIFDSISENKLVHFIHRLLSSLLMPPIILLDNIGIEPRRLKKLLYNYSQWYAKRNENSPYAYLPLTWTFDSFKDRRILKKDMFPSQRVPFESGYFPIANNYDSALRVTYGDDYMKMPDLGKRQAKHIKAIEI